MHYLTKQLISEKNQEEIPGTEFGPAIQYTHNGQMKTVFGKHGETHAGVLMNNEHIPELNDAVEKMDDSAIFGFYHHPTKRFFPRHQVKMIGTDREIQSLDLIGKDARFTIAEQYLIEAVDWQRPQGTNEHNEAGYQADNASDYPKHLSTELNKMKSPGYYKKKLAGGTVQTVQPDQRSHINNHDQTTKGLNPDKLKRVAGQFKAGKVTMPIIMKHQKTGHEHLLAGNTRLAYNGSVRKQPTQALYINY